MSNVTKYVQNQYDSEKLIIRNKNPGYMDGRSVLFVYSNLIKWQIKSVILLTPFNINHHFAHIMTQIKLKMYIWMDVQLYD